MKITTSMTTQNAIPSRVSWEHLKENPGVYQSIEGTGEARLVSTPMQHVFYVNHGRFSIAIEDAWNRNTFFLASEPVTVTFSNE